jgi:hypothetical protein
MTNPPPLCRMGTGAIRRWGLAVLLAGTMACGTAYSQTATDVFAARWPAGGAARDGKAIGVQTVPLPPPRPQPRRSERQAALTPAAQSQPRPEPRTALIKFASAPFPYNGPVPTTGEPFLNVAENGRKGHRTARGGVLWESTTFGDNRVLLHIPRGFDVTRPAVMVVFFHGHGAELTRDVLNRQNVPEQITRSGMNAVLVAPQFAVDAADSSAGRFWEPGGFVRFVREAGAKLAALDNNPAAAARYGNLPVIIVAYSGGYLPAAYSIRQGGLGKKLKGLVLMDGLYGEMDDFIHFIKNAKSSFFISSYTASTRRQNTALAQTLKAQHIPYDTHIRKNLWRRGGVALIETENTVRHRDFVTEAWTGNPIADILDKLD